MEGIISAKYFTLLCVLQSIGCLGASCANVGACGIVETPYEALLVGLSWPQDALGKAGLIDKVWE